jgi:hypothetical protein
VTFNVTSSGATGPIASNIDLAKDIAIHYPSTTTDKRTPGKNAYASESLTSIHPKKIVNSNIFKKVEGGGSLGGGGGCQGNTNNSGSKPPQNARSYLYNQHSG